MNGGVDDFAHADSAGLHDLWQGESECRTEGYLTDLITQRAVDWIGRVGADPAPLSLSLHYTAPHWPWQARGDRARHIDGSLFDLAGGNIHTYRRMIHHMDEGIGQVLRAL
jgi:hypothetical protein